MWRSNICTLKHTRYNNIKWKAFRVIVNCLPILGWGRGCRCSHADDPILRGGRGLTQAEWTVLRALKFVRWQHLNFFICLLLWYSSVHQPHWMEAKFSERHETRTVFSKSLAAICESFQSRNHRPSFIEARKKGTVSSNNFKQLKHMLYGFKK